MTENLQQEITEGKFDRNVELVVVQDDEIFAITRNRIDFRVEKFPGGLVNNRANVTVYNLNFKVRAILTKRRLDLKAKPFTDVFISTGYKSDGSTAMIFRGQLIDGSNSRVGPDWITTFEAFTAFEQGANAILAPQKHSYLETRPKTIVNDLFTVLNYNKVRFSLEAETILDAEQKVTQAFAGRADAAIQKFLGQFDLVFKLEDDGPVVVVSGSATNTEQAAEDIPLISVETGLIGTPKITHQGVEIKTLLNPDLKIFKRFRLTSLTTDGSLAFQDQQFTTMKLQHFGSNRSEDFFTELRGVFYPRLSFNTSEPDSPTPFTVPEGFSSNI